MEFKPQLVLPGLAESCSKMYILPTLTYLEVGVPAAASEISIFVPFNYEPIGGGIGFLGFWAIFKFFVPGSKNTSDLGLSATSDRVIAVCLG